MNTITKIIIGLVAVIIIAAISSQLSKEKKQRDEKIKELVSGAENPKSTLQVPIAYSAQLNELFNDLKSEEDDLSRLSLERPADIITASEMFNKYITFLEIDNADSTKKYAQKVQQLKTAVINSQKRVFPKLRTTFHKYIASVLWQSDVDVIENSKGGTTLTFIGSHFAANRNKQSTQESFNKYFTALRYKRINYKWYKNADELTYYTVDSKKDSDL